MQADRPTRARSRLTHIAAALVAAVLCGAGEARAHDSLAPPGATHNWLPEEEWVHRHWLPFDGLALRRALGLAPGQLEAYLYDDHHTLADLARARGLDPAVLAEQLVAPWPAPADRAMLRDRTLRVLTQGHLAQHMFFHLFHGIALAAHSDHVFGMPVADYRALRTAGRSYAEIAARGGMATSVIGELVTSQLIANRHEGVLRLEAWPAEAGRILARTLARLGCWLQRPAPERDASNPYGKNRLLHGAHDAAWPATATERRTDERRAERHRRALARSCWTHPAKYIPAA